MTRRYRDPATGRLLTAARPGVRPGMPLTARERSIIERLANGMTVSEIAAADNVSHKTTEAHLCNARIKMRARTRTHLVALYLRPCISKKPYRRRCTRAMPGCVRPYQPGSSRPRRSLVGASSPPSARTVAWATSPHDSQGRVRRTYGNGTGVHRH